MKHDDLALKVTIHRHWNGKWQLRLNYVGVYHPVIYLNRKYRIGRLLPVLHNMSQDSEAGIYNQHGVELEATVADLRKVFLQKRYHRYLDVAIKAELSKGV